MEQLNFFSKIATVKQLFRVSKVNSKKYEVEYYCYGCKEYHLNSKIIVKKYTVDFTTALETLDKFITKISEENKNGINNEALISSIPAMNALLSKLAKKHHFEID